MGSTRDPIKIYDAIFFSKSIPLVQFIKGVNEFSNGGEPMNDE